MAHVDAGGVKLYVEETGEGIPVVLMEGMACGLPVVASRISGIPELVIPDRTGWLFPAGSVDALVEALEKCLRTSDDVLNRMGEEGYKKVLLEHRIEVEAMKLIDLFQKD